MEQKRKSMVKLFNKSSHSNDSENKNNNKKKFQR